MERGHSVKEKNPMAKKAVRNAYGNAMQAA